MARSGEGGWGFSRRFWKERMESEIEWWREEGREEQRGEEAGMAWIKVLRVDFDDLRLSFPAEERKSSAEDRREERSLFSISEANFGFSVIPFSFSKIWEAGK